jgi:hypothetical protein
MRRVLCRGLGDVYRTKAMKKADSSGRNEIFTGNKRDWQWPEWGEFKRKQAAEDDRKKNERDLSSRGGSPRQFNWV